MGFPQDAGGALFVFRNRSFPKAFRGIHDSVEQPSGGPGVRRARPACPGTGQCSAGAGARASAGPHPARPPWGGTAAARWGWGPGLGQGREAPGVGETVRTASLEARGPGEQVGVWTNGRLVWPPAPARVCGCARVSVQAPAGRGSTLTPSWEPPPPTGVREP